MLPAKGQLTTAAEQIDRLFKKHVKKAALYNYRERITVYFSSDFGKFCKWKTPIWLQQNILILSGEPENDGISFIVISLICSFITDSVVEIGYAR